MSENRTRDRDYYDRAWRQGTIILVAFVVMCASTALVGGILHRIYPFILGCIGTLYGALWLIDRAEL